MQKGKTVRKGIKNYTTTISTESTISEIEKLLARHGAKKIMKEYDDNQQVINITFMVKYNTGFVPIRLPSNPEKVLVLLNEKVDEKAIPQRFRNDKEQAQRIMWRVILDWIDAQMALVEIGQRNLLQVFFADICSVVSDETLYESLIEEELPRYLIADNKRNG